MTVIDDSLAINNEGEIRSIYNGDSWCIVNFSDEDAYRMAQFSLTTIFGEPERCPDFQLSWKGTDLQEAASLGRHSDADKKLFLLISTAQQLGYLDDEGKPCLPQ